ncbi:ADP-ribosylation/crystallin J1 [Trichocoleus sp. FACHB-262]|uniref:ADP-ribosylation/crystallin J1 n=1 Tax=Trichocoleus sp. FACHB-262 TaxID=2692869 RepID=UPI0016837719|nr:ADP-ribosylation/crystallin J1 [Trichocoleus sp. FACHB-262]MBD2121139.1 ADP-ribosylation/crystallin J1 [Trichocoleus sp. FACHB-262]
MLLYRPVGLKELELIAQSSFKAFPPRLLEQPIFYPVLNFEYAEKIARDWNTKSNSFAGFVTQFEVEDAYVQQFAVQVVGSAICQELWVPAEELAEFNRHIIGQIQISAAFYGEKFQGELDAATNMPKGIPASAIAPQ